MIIHLGGDVVVPVSNIIAIIDMESAGQASINREFLKTAEDEGFITKISEDPPKSFILAEFDKKTVIYMSPISSITLLKRSTYVDEISLDRE